MKRCVLIAMLLSSGSLLAADADPFAGGSAEAGAGKAAVCGACHGPAGNSTNPDWPKLAGQHARYTYDTLKALKTGRRPSQVMGPQAAGLSEQDMKDLAAYFAAQKPTPGVASPASVAVAQPLYRAGDPARKLPACAACHGPEGAGNAAAAYPRISGQHAKYTAGVLRTFRDLAGNEEVMKKLGDDLNFVMMATVAAKLTDAEIEALASYVNGLH